MTHDLHNTICIAVRVVFTQLIHNSRIDVSESEFQKYHDYSNIKHKVLVKNFSGSGLEMFQLHVAVSNIYLAMERKYYGG